MSKKIEKLLEQIDELETQLFDEIEKKEEEVRKTIEDETDHLHDYIVSTKEYLSSFSLATIISLPFIWMMIIPIVIIDIFVTIYQAICFPLYKIPKVKRKEYVIIDRYKLFYLDRFQKINCWYCEYFNGVVAYVREIAARTEQFWCPIKHSKKLKDRHSRYDKFFSYGDFKNYKEKFDQRRSQFQDIENKK